ncbi:MAG: response regulator [Deltaproteobacteria bacterium]|nr:response regulator [Deltaproteobacteria bacterium]
MSQPAQSPGPDQHGKEPAKSRKDSSKVRPQGNRRAVALSIVAGFLLVVGTWLVDMAAFEGVPWQVYARSPAHWVLILTPVLAWFFVWRLSKLEPAVRTKRKRREGERSAIQPLVRSARRSERSAQAVMENVLDGIVVLTGEGVVQDVNPALERMFGYSKYELIGKDMKLLVPKHGEPDSAISTFRRTVTNEIMGVEWQMEGRHKDGTAIPLELSFNAVDVDEQKLFIYVMRDISARKEEEEKRKRIHEELAAARDHALAASRSKSVFLASVSHELRTPLNAILGYSEMLHEDIDEEKHAELSADLSKIHNAGKHLLQVINTILDLSKIEAGRMETFLETFDVRKLVSNVIATIRPMALQNGNDLEVWIAPEVSHLTSDATKVRQTLFNLLSNANKFTQEGTIRVEVDHVQGEDGPWIAFRIIDTGIGMTQEQMERLFQEFTQAHARTYRQYGGTGLGLAISRRFANMLQGDITVESELGEGSVFTLLLPERTISPTEEEPTEVPEPERTDDFIAGRPPGIGTILVVDDDRTVRELLHRHLTKDGFAVATAASGQEALRLARELRPTAITLDVMMPEMDGWSVLSQLKADDELADIPVIMLTMVSDRSMGYALGATDYLSKPIDRTKLSAVLRRYRCANPPCPVLVVEDEGDIRELMVRMLTKEGWAVSEAANGREALERVEENLPELILLDLLMPDMDGFEFLAELRMRPVWRRIPVVVVTAMDLTEEDNERLRGSVSRILRKGVHSHDQLLQEVHSAVHEAVQRQVDQGRE